MKFLIWLREKWRRRRERIKRLNAARYSNAGFWDSSTIVHAHHREDKGGRRAKR
jgi:hypothetical protein